MSKSNQNRSRNFKRNQRPKNKKGKEFEVNVSDSGINKEDIKGMFNGVNLKHNDPSWYAVNPALLRDAASLSFNTPLGTTITWGLDPAVSGSNLLDITGATDSIPGIMTIEYFPTIGPADSAISPINYAMNRLYSYIRHANSGTPQGDAPDYGMYIVAMDSVYSYYAFMTRLYGLATLAYYTNRYYPKYLIQAMGFDYDDIIAHLADLRYYINSFAYRANALCVPNRMTYIARHIWMTSGVFKDSTNVKAQTYLFVPSYFYTYNATVVPGGRLSPSISFVSGQGSPTFKVADLQTNGENMLRPLLASEDFNVMSGDLMKAFGKDNLFSLNPISEEYVVEPQYSEEVLSQIENLTVLGSVSASGNIEQNVAVGNGFLKQNIILSSTTSTQGNFVGAGIPKMINMHHDSPTPDDVMVATRLASFVDRVPVADQQVSVSPLSYCTEFVERLRIWSLSKGEAGTGIELTAVEIHNPALNTASTALGMQLAALSQFDWSPIMPIITISDTGTVEIQGYTGDVDNYTFISSNVLDRMNETAALSLFSVPELEIK